MDTSISLATSACSIACRRMLLPTRMLPQAWWCQARPNARVRAPSWVHSSKLLLLPKWIDSLCLVCAAMLVSVPSSNQVSSTHNEEIQAYQEAPVQAQQEEARIPPSQAGPSPTRGQESLKTP